MYTLLKRIDNYIQPLKDLSFEDQIQLLDSYQNFN